MKKPILKRSFNGGEIAPSLWVREDVEQVSKSCRELKNFLIHPHGAIRRRPGFVRWKEL